jgi:hypothetical protein
MDNKGDILLQCTTLNPSKNSVEMGQIWYKVFDYICFCNFKRRNNNFYFATYLSLTNSTTIYNKHNFHLLYTSRYSLKVGFFWRACAMVFVMVYTFFVLSLEHIPSINLHYEKVAYNILYNICVLPNIFATTPLMTKKTSLIRGMIKRVPQFQLT